MEHANVTCKQILTGFLHRRLKLCEAFAFGFGFINPVFVGLAQAASKTRNGFGPGESIPVQRRWLARNNCRCFFPRSPLQCVTCLRGREMKRRLETWFQSRG